MLVNALKDASLLSHVHPHAGIENIIKVFAKTADFLKCPAPEESFRLHDQTVIRPIRSNLEEIIKTPERRRGDKSISAVLGPEAATTRYHINLGMPLKHFCHFGKDPRFVSVIGIKPCQDLSAGLRKPLIDGSSLTI